MSQGMFGGVALVLGIVGLAIGAARPGAQVYLDAIAQISLGVALVAFGAALSIAYLQLVSRVSPNATLSGTVAGTTADMFLGGAVIILGVLALLMVAPSVLIPVQVILIGVGLLLNSLASVRAATLQLNASATANDQALVRQIHEELTFATASARAVAGIAVAILGILGLVGTDIMVLTLVAAIIAGAAMLLASTTLSNRLIGTLAAHA